MTITYNNNIPNAPNNPSNDQPLMFVNTNSISTFLAVDHVGFGVSGATNGYHNMSSYAVQGSPPTAVNSAARVFSQNVTYPGGHIDLELFMGKAANDSDNPSSVIQLTNTRFSPTNTGLAANPKYFTTYLPGGLIMIGYSDQNTYNANAFVLYNNNTFTFPTQILTVVATGLKSSAIQFVVNASQIQLNGFKIQASDKLDGISYIAIGY